MVLKENDTGDRIEQCLDIGAFHTWTVAAALNEKMNSRLDNSPVCWCFSVISIASQAGCTSKNRLLSDDNRQISKVKVPREKWSQELPTSNALVDCHQYYVCFFLNLTAENSRVYELIFKHNGNQSSKADRNGYRRKTYGHHSVCIMQKKKKNYSSPDILVFLLVNARVVCRQRGFIET